MAHTLPTLYATGAPTNFSSDWDANTNTWADINEPIASPDGVEMGDDANNPGDHFLYVTLTDMPSDFPVSAPTSTGAMATLNFNIRYRVTGAQTNWRGLALQVLTDEGTPTALTNEYVLFGATSSSDRITNTTATNSGQLSFTGVSLFSGKTAWDNAVLRLRLIIDKQMGGDTNGIRVDTFELNGTYHVGYTRTASLAGTATIAATGQKSAATHQRSASVSGTATVAATPLYIAFRTASVDGTSTVTVAGTRIAFRTASVDGTATIAAAGERVAYGVGSVDGTSTVSAAGVRIASRTASIDGTATIVATGLYVGLRTASVDGTSTVGATGIRIAFRTASVDGTSTVGATGTRIAFRTASVDGTSTVSAAGVRIASRTASVAGTATVDAIGQKVGGAKQRSASLGGTATIAAAGFKVVARTASAAGVATITSAGLLVAQRTTSVAGTATITSTGVWIGVRSGSVFGTGTIAVLGGKPTTLRPDADGTGWSNWTGAWTEIDDDPDSPTADFVRNTGGLDGTGWYRLSDSAADYDTGLEARVKVRAAGLDATSGVTLSARLYLSDQSTPITDSVLVGTYNDTSESTVEVVMPWTSGTPPTKTQIDDAYLRLDVNVP